MGLLKIQKKIMPKRYFHYERLIDGLSEDVSYLGVLFRTSVPVITGLLAGLTALTFQHGENLKLIGAAVGFFSAFCLVWPDYYNPELISPTYANQKSKLYILYIIVIIIFSLGGWAGAMLAPVFANIDASVATSNLDAKEIYNGVVVAVICLILAGIFRWVVTLLRVQDDHS
jgi:MFS superfamily sulfate permease-like transporter